MPVMRLKKRSHSSGQRPMDAAISDRVSFSEKCAWRNSMVLVSRSFEVLFPGVSGITEHLASFRMSGQAERISPWSRSSQPSKCSPSEMFTIRLTVLVRRTPAGWLASKRKAGGREPDCLPRQSGWEENQHNSRQNPVRQVLQNERTGC